MTESERQAAIEALRARRKARGMDDPTNRLVYHVSGKVERGEYVPVVEVKP